MSNLKRHDKYIECNGKRENIGIRFSNGAASVDHDPRKDRQQMTLLLERNGDVNRREVLICADEVDSIIESLSAMRDIIAKPKGGDES